MFVVNALAGAVVGSVVALVEVMLAGRLAMRKPEPVGVTSRAAQPLTEQHHAEDEEQHCHHRRVVRREPHPPAVEHAGGTLAAGEQATTGT